MDVRFLGATGTVTGSKYLVTEGDTRLLVDCGLYQGVKHLRLRNRAPLPFEPGELDAVVLTHAHLDHSGFVPALVRDGFAGPVHVSELTGELCAILLPDAGHIQEEDAAYANRKGFSKHHPALPLYTEEDAVESLASLAPLDFGRWLRVGALEVRLRPAGHILGAASVEVRSGSRTLLFSGDLGRDDDLLMLPPEPPGSPDWIVVESTYGDRDHPDVDPVAAVAEILRRTVDRGGVLLVPAFAVGRTQTLLYCLHEIFARGLAPPVPVYVNSPMATNVTHLFRRSHAFHRLDAKRSESVCGLPTYVRSVEESRRLCERRDPAVILSASGMATGGRILHHLKALAPDPRHTILLPGFQAPGTRGDALARGCDRVKIHGGQVPVEAEVIQLDVFSAHADRGGLVRWVAAAGSPPRGVFVTHGEDVAADALRLALQDELGVAARVPEYGETAAL